MSEELISKEQAMAYPLSYEHYDKVNGSIKFINGVESYRDYIDGLQTVERRHGHWIEDKQGDIKCSNCGMYLYPMGIRTRYIGDICRKLKTNFCPDCGAIMDEKVLASEEKQMDDEIDDEEEQEDWNNLIGEGFSI